MGILQDLVTKLQSCQETKASEPAAEEAQEGSELFLEVNQSSPAEANKEQVGKSSALSRDLYLMDLVLCSNDDKLQSNLIPYYIVFRTISFNMAPCLFRSSCLHWDPSSSIRVWSSGFWLWSWLLCRHTH